MGGSFNSNPGEWEGGRISHTRTSFPSNIEAASVYNSQGFASDAQPYHDGFGRSPSTSSLQEVGAEPDLAGPLADAEPSPPTHRKSGLPLPPAARKERPPSLVLVELDDDVEMGFGRCRHDRQPDRLGNDPNRPCRTEAMLERSKRQLRAMTKDKYGVPIRGTERKFSLWASPFHVAEVCKGLGVYLASVRAMCLLAFFLVLCAIYMIVNNIGSQKFATEYRLITGVSSFIPLYEISAFIPVYKRHVRFSSFVSNPHHRLVAKVELLPKLFLLSGWNEWHHVHEGMGSSLVDYNYDYRRTL